MKAAAKPAAGRRAAAILRRAQALCEEKGLRFTPMRRRVLEELARGAEPLTAYDLLDKVRDDKPVAPVTVYRALDFLLQARLIHRIVTRNAYMPCDHAPHDEDAPVLLVCARCGSVDEIPSDEIERDLGPSLAKVGFTPRQLVFEIEGECAKCHAGG
jgi:Fur family zinc uptake transcriptional regulator